MDRDKTTMKTYFVLKEIISIHTFG